MFGCVRVLIPKLASATMEHNFVNEGSKPNAHHIAHFKPLLPIGNIIFYLVSFAYLIIESALLLGNCQ